MLSLQKAQKYLVDLNQFQNYLSSKIKYNFQKTKVFFISTDTHYMSNNKKGKLSMQSNANYKLFNLADNEFITSGSITYDYTNDSLDCEGEVLQSNEYFAEQANELGEKITNIESELGNLKVTFETTYAVITL